MAEMTDPNCTTASTDAISAYTADSVRPQFRLACEECHVRKIRCEPSLKESGGSCEPCRLNQRRCFFSLRSKIGRPRKKTPSAKQQRSPPPTSFPLAELLPDYQVLDDIPDSGPGGRDAFGRQLLTSECFGAHGDLFMPDLTQLSDLLQADPLAVESPPAESDSETCTLGGGERGFLDALKLYSDIHNDINATALDLLAEIDQDKLWSILQLFEDLIQTACTLQPTSSSSLLQRIDRPESGIIRVALMEATQVSIHVIQFNFQLHNTISPADGGVRCPLEESSDSSSSSNKAAGCNCLVLMDERQLRLQLKSLELLVRLEYSLVRFRYFLSRADCFHASTSQRLISQRVCKCWAESIPEIATARFQISALMEKFRRLWD
ncbi:hypothetical protein BDW59DRAFT_164507 [Aspergillus cavernicola]|uniref:Zn(2)-C6 fungal-type domain-containing protein n=1 Tax=Aspergillus cavernicola TaxID=176166 RepID=A0ABR4I1Q9_9EURO